MILASSIAAPIAANALAWSEMSASLRVQRSRSMAADLSARRCRAMEW